ncbi:hypothetical protein [Pseudoclavibacter sp. CFCC 11306]|uniref:hypothetical protein n=1 Tax=Pseudoclavibacter sp. CFCC 11306 TaxID=1564493 RepID=UPI001300D698|nr:hypothetical protein [Pseudoclavibacter sp. CFCC 11306]KAB1658847.1 hypothetical protein F8O09_04550 [Pseudoclavibacter sp. CFCC 11306]
MARKTQPSRGPQLFGAARVNLLPPGQVHRLDVRSARRLIAILGTSFVLANGVLIAYGAASQSLVNRQLDSAQQQTQQLQAELAKNSEAINLGNDIVQLQNDRMAVTAREADLHQLLADVSSSTPENMRITKFDLQSVGAGAGSGSSAGSSSSAEKPSAANIGSISITANSSDLPNISQWIDNVRKVHGVAGITAQSVRNLEDAADGSSASSDETGFQSNLTIVLSTDVFTHRFAQATADAGAGSQTNGVQQ